MIKGIADSLNGPQDNNMSLQRSITSHTNHNRQNATTLLGFKATADENTSSKAVQTQEDTAPYFHPEVPPQVSENTSNLTLQLNPQNLQILIAEDDPINSRIMKKRLEKRGHHVHSTTNGEECAHVYREKLAFFDVVLMDMQVSTPFDFLM
jgi:PleD family two-component response regulator